MRFFLVIAAVSLLSGCAGLKPPGPLLSGGERERVVAAFSSLAAQQAKCASGLEAWFSGQLHAAGRRVPVSGELRMKAPAAASLTAVDPLGRPALMAVVSDGTFTVVDVAAAVVYTGGLEARRVRRFVPRPVAASLFYYLAGMLPPGSLLVKGVYGSGRAEVYYVDFTLAGEEGYSHQVLLSLEDGHGKMVSHALLGKDGDPLVTFAYGGPGRECMASEIRVASGKAGMDLRIGEVSRLSGGGFSLSWPPMFRVVEVR